MRKLTMLALLIALAAALAVAQENPPTPSPAPPAGARPVMSPPGQASFALADGKKITVDYSRPYIRNRKIMGDLVPYGKVWRTGANAATSFTADADLVLAGARIPAGKYTLYTIPGEQSWIVIINKQTGQWGTKYEASQDLVRVQAKPARLAQPVDQFTISFEGQGANAGVMKLEWENTSVAVPFNEAK